ncbi:MAG: preprotein translocase subunit YajC [Clostridia bacterium]|nr:preprotein translocase subunit YajC [Clostridia bacterium]
MDPNMLGTVVWLVVMIALFYFMLIRPQKKRERETKAMLDALKVGDSVTTVGGIIGTVLRIKDDKVCIEIGDRTHKHPMTIKREAVASVVPCTKKPKKTKVEAIPEEVDTAAEVEAAEIETATEE